MASAVSETSVINTKSSAKPDWCVLVAFSATGPLQANVLAESSHLLKNFKARAIQFRHPNIVNG